VEATIETFHPKTDVASKDPATASTAAAKVVRVTGELPAMPHIAAQVMEKLSNPNSTARDIHQLISKDQGLAARVLKVANSPYYGACRSISSLRDAVLFMGFDSIRSLIMTAVLKGMFSALTLYEKLLWEHSIACGVAARHLSKETGYQRTEEAFLTGLMHDIGKTVLLLRVPSAMQDIIQETYNTGSDFATIERQSLGFTHAEVGQIIADQWRFALDIEDAIANHHTPEKARSARDLTRIISVSDSICHKLEIGPTRKPELELTELESVKALALTPDALLRTLEAVKETLSKEGAGI
jgi:HD-like signal output (HDOD) protein